MGSMWQLRAKLAAFLILAGAAALAMTAQPVCAQEPSASGTIGSISILRIAVPSDSPPVCQ